MNADEPPHPLGFARVNEGKCRTVYFEEQDYSCASRWGDSLDAWIESYGASQRSGRVVSIQDTVSFTYNATQETVQPREHGGTFELVTWSPSRQILDGLSKDLEY